MKAEHKNILLTVLGLLLLVGGFLTGKFTAEANSPASHHIEIQSKEMNLDETSYTVASLSEKEDQGMIDNILMTFLYRQPADAPLEQLEDPDMLLSVFNHEKVIGMIDARIWFDADGALLSMPSGEVWQQTNYFRLTKEDTDSLREYARLKEK